MSGKDTGSSISIIIVLAFILGSFAIIVLGAALYRCVYRNYWDTTGYNPRLEYIYYIQTDDRVIDIPNSSDEDQQNTDMWSPYAKQPLGAVVAED